MKDPVVYIEHIHEAILKIKGYTKAMSLEKFLDKTIVQDAVIRNFELIGVASKNIDDIFKKKYENIEWNKMARMQCKLTHDFIGVDLWAIWGVVEKILPELEKQILEIINKEKNSN